MTLKKLCPILLILLIATPDLSFAQEKKARKMIIVGVIQSLSHPNFNTDAKGFEKALTDAGFKEGIHLTYQRQNAEGNGANAQAIVQKFLDTKVDLIHSIASLASQAAVKTINHTPIVFSSVTDPVDEGLVPKTSSPGTKSGTNVTGVTDRWPVQQQFEMYSKFFPKAKKWGTLYNAGDPKSLIHIKEMRDTAKRLGVELIEAMISSKAETKQAAQSLAGKIQALNITFDDTALSSFEAIVKVCNEKKIPLFAGGLDLVPNGAIAAYGSTYFGIGYSAGKKAARILLGEKPGNIPWGPGGKLSLVVNEKAARAQGAIIPPGLLKRADKIIQE